MSEQKKSFTLSAKYPNWRREWDSNPRGRGAQRLSCQSTNIQMGSRGRRFNHSAIPAQPATKTGTSLKPFPVAGRTVRSTRVGRQDTLDKGQSTLKARILPLNPPRENVIHHNPLPQHGQMVPQRLLVSEIDPHRILLVELYQGLVYDHASRSPERLV